MDVVLSEKLYQLCCNTHNLCKRQNSELYKDLFSIQYSILFYLYKNNKVTPTELVQNLGIAKSNIATFCKNLEKKKQITHVKSEEDKRSICYTLTDYGKKYVVKLQEKFCDVLGGSFSSSSEREVANKLQEILDLIFRGEKC